MDIARRRAESYARPGALPDVRPGSTEQDLARRDFTINAIAAPLAGDRAGELLPAAHALEDLRGGWLRVLHEDSFREDPTRLLRLARYAARLGFSAEQRTGELAREAIAAGALATVSAARIGAELRLTLAEDDAPAALEELARGGVLAAIGPGLAFDGAAARGALELLPADGRADLLLMGVLLLDSADPGGLLDELGFPAGERDIAARTALQAERIAGVLEVARCPSQVLDAAAAAPCEAVALAGALAGDHARESARRWLTVTRHVRLQISGDDLLAAGIPAGPDIGARLRAALAARVDGELAAGRESELRAALSGL